MNAVVIAALLLVVFIVLGALATYTRPGRALDNILAALIGGTDTDEGAHHG